MKRLKSWLQKHHLMHTWSTWESCRYLYTPFIKGFPISSMAVEILGQKRTCCVCGKKQIRQL